MKMMYLRHSFASLCPMALLLIPVCSQNAVAQTSNCLCFTALQCGATVTLMQNGSPAELDGLRISSDGINWTNYDVGETVTLAEKDDCVYFRAANKNSTFGSYDSSTKTYNYYSFSTTDSLAASGNLMSLLDSACTQISMPNYGFYCLFSGCEGLVSAPDLPATTVSSNCYNSMFDGCKSLAAAPALPAVKLKTYCYANMFRGCTSLRVAPELPATTLASYCYSHMFDGCTSLISAPALPATTLVGNCYKLMFNGCTSLVEAPALPAAEMKSDCYYGMFDGCTSLVKAPKLEAETLASRCYYNMFNGCASLVEATDLPAMTLAKTCYYGMFQNCTKLEKAPKLPATTLISNCYERMFYNCKQLKKVPTLPASTLEAKCYSNIFFGCSQLDTIKVELESWSDGKATADWLSGVASSGIFICSDLLDAESVGTSYVPTGWTVKTYPKTVTLNGCGMATFSCEVDVAFDRNEAGAYVCVLDLPNHQIDCNEVDADVIPAGTGVLLVGNDDDAAGRTISFRLADDVPDVWTETENDLRPTSTGEIPLVDVPDGACYVLNGGAFNRYVGSVFSARKAYFCIEQPTVVANATSMRLVFSESEVKTSICAIEEVMADAEVRYDLCGRRLTSDKKRGFVVRNGRVVVGR